MGFLIGIIIGAIIATVCDMSVMIFSLITHILFRNEVLKHERSNRK